MQFNPSKFIAPKINNIVILIHFEDVTVQEVLNVMSVRFLFETLGMY
jgi:hypothetical protein